MSLEYARDLWHRAENALRAAEALVPLSPDDAASRAYYAVFHAATAAFVLEGRTFRRHAGLRGAVHRDWVNVGEWPVEFGADFDALWELRDVGDYGGSHHVTPEDAAAAVEAACRILEAIHEGHKAGLEI